MSDNLSKEIMSKLKSIKCQQPQCLSSKQESPEVAVVGDNCKRKGLMCTSCFIDQELITSLGGDVETRALSVQKFLKVLAEYYEAYAQEKGKAAWPPLKVAKERE
jgi:hypothetical protein